MKRILFTLVFLLAALGIRAADISNISNAFKQGNASALTSSMSGEVDMAVPGSSRKCNASEAASMLADFFSNNRPTGFSVVHHADKKESGFFVAKLQTGKGEFRVNVTYQAKGKNVMIQSIRIE